MEVAPAQLLPQRSRTNCLDPDRSDVNSAGALERVTCLQ
jgi:hypothetical protein